MENIANHLHEASLLFKCYDWGKCILKCELLTDIEIYVKMCKCLGKWMHMQSATGHHWKSRNLNPSEIGVGRYFIKISHRPDHL